MDRIEHSLGSGDEAARYLEVLFGKVEDARYPSLSHLDRIERVLAQLAIPAGSGRG